MFARGHAVWPGGKAPPPVPRQNSPRSTKPPERRAVAARAAVCRPGGPDSERGGLVRSDPSSTQWLRRQCSVSGMNTSSSPPASEASFPKQLRSLTFGGAERAQKDVRPLRALECLKTLDR